MNINVYDMLVFEDENGSIYQDCVYAIDNEVLKQYDRIVIRANRFYIIIEDDEVFTIVDTNKYFNNTDAYYLKEIWTRTDENTYKKVWSE